MLESRLISVPIRRDWREVYAFAHVPENFPRWAAGLAASLHRGDDGLWTAETPEGIVRIRFTPPNDYGILDHYVTLPSGEEIYIPLRVTANGEGAEVQFTLFRLPSMTDELFEHDAGLVHKDLLALKSLLE